MPRRCEPLRALDGDVVATLLSPLHELLRFWDEYLEIVLHISVPIVNGINILGPFNGSCVCMRLSVAIGFFGLAPDGPEDD